MDELKELVKKQAVLNADTNRMVHKLHRQVWWGRVWSIVWWAGILILSSAAYYYYLQPYVEQLVGLYGNAQDWQVQIGNFFAGLRER